MRNPKDFDIENNNIPTENTTSFEGAVFFFYLPTRNKYKNTKTLYKYNKSGTHLTNYDFGGYSFFLDNFNLIKEDFLINEMVFFLF